MVEYYFKIKSCTLDLKETVECLKKKYGDKDQHHQTLVRQLSHATEKVMLDQFTIQLSLKLMMF